MASPYLTSGAPVASGETAAAGLTAAVVAEQVALGRTNATRVRTSRTVGEIVRANVLTVFNGILVTLFVYVPGFLHRVLRFSVPAGVITGIGAYAAYAVARRLDPAAGVPGARTTATLVVLVVALWTLVVLARSLRTWKIALLVAMAGIAALVVAVPWLGEQVVLLQVTPGVVGLAAVVGAACALLVEVSSRVSTPAPTTTRSRRAR